MLEIYLNPLEWTQKHAYSFIIHIPYNSTDDKSTVVTDDILFHSLFVFAYFDVFSVPIMSVTKDDVGNFYRFDVDGKGHTKLIVNGYVCGRKAASVDTGRTSWRCLARRMK